MKKPKKLVRSIHSQLIPDFEKEIILDPLELNELYAFKIQEELAEIQQSSHTDIMEFVDLIQVAFDFAQVNGFTELQLIEAGSNKLSQKGCFTNIALNNLNPNNPSNALYFMKANVES